MILEGFPQLPLPPDERTVPDMLRLQAQRYGERPLFSCLDDRWTFAQAPGIAARMAGALAAADIRAGDRVAILSPNRPEIMRVLVGCGWLGAVAVPLNIAVKERQLRYYLENSGARLLVADGTLLSALPAGSLKDLALERVWTIGDDPAGAGAASDLPTSRFSGDGEELPARPASPGDPFAILYTSGTTGAPKGVVCPQAQFHWWALYTARYLQMRDGDVLATTLPLFHTNAINTFFQALLTGSTQVVLPRFSASQFWTTMKEANATVGYLLGAMVPMLMAQPVTPAERSHRVRVALGPGVPPGMHHTLFERTGVRLIDGFGSTETNFIIGGTADERVPGKMGTVQVGVTAKVVDENDNELPAEVAGELVVRADEPFCFSNGYFDMPDKTVEAWRNLWFHTGDRVVRHADGTFSFLDRLKDVIRRRGENISSFEVEQVVAAHPAVETVAVFPVPSDLAEDEVMAAIVVKPGMSLPHAEFFAYCAKELPRHAVPRYLDIVEALPRTENGKVQKFKLREIGVTATTVDRTTLV